MRVPVALDSCQHLVVLVLGIFAILIGNSRITLLLNVQPPNDTCWSWNSNTLATSCKELTHWKRPWCWEGLGAGGEGEDRGWDGWMASPTRWTWVWVNSGSWWWTGRPGVLGFMGSQRVGHDWVTELNWTEWHMMWNIFSFAYLPSIYLLWQRFRPVINFKLGCFFPIVQF